MVRRVILSIESGIAFVLENHAIHARTRNILGLDHIMQNGQRTYSTNERRDTMPIKLLSFFLSLS